MLVVAARRGHVKRSAATDRLHSLVLTAALWGLVQGLSEFLPISSSGHLVLVPALLDVDPPTLAISAVLHVGTLGAVIWYFRKEVAYLLRFRTDPDARRLLSLLIVGSIPAGIAGLTLEGFVEDLNEDPTKVAIALLATGVILIASELLRRRHRRLDTANVPDALVVGVAQAAALIPGISRSGVTMVAGFGRHFTSVDAARFSFLLAIPAIAASGLVEGVELADAGGLTASIWVGVAVAAVSGYAAIAVLLRLLRRTGLGAFGVYCLAFGTFALVAV